jgi:uncharacterized Rmd1/YagE family protein
MLRDHRWRYVRKRNPTKRNDEICKVRKENITKRNEIYKVRKQYQMKKRTNSVKVRGLGSSCTIWLSHMFVSVPKANPDLIRHGYVLYCLLVFNNLRWEIVDNTLTDVCHAIATETCQKYSVTVIFYYIFHDTNMWLSQIVQLEPNPLTLERVPVNWETERNETKRKQNPTKSVK